MILVVGYSVGVYAESVRFRQSVSNPIYKVYRAQATLPALVDTVPRKFQRKFGRNAKVLRSGITIRWDCTPCVPDSRAYHHRILLSYRWGTS